MSDLLKIDSVAGVSIYAVKGTPKSFLYRAGLAVDGDGSPNCYGPNNSGLDYTANGGTPGSNWWGGPTDSHLNPIIQKIYDPSPGMYVSSTSLINNIYDESSPYRYIDSESIPFIVLPGKHSNDAHLGDVCWCYNQDTGDNCYGIFADVGPQDSIGEVSIRMATALGIENTSPKNGGTDKKIISYVVFPGSIGMWTPPDVWFGTANTLVTQWGGIPRLKQLLEEM
jgi:hypothetical protein